MTVSVDRREVIAQFEYKATCDTRRMLQNDDCVVFATELNDVNISGGSSSNGGLSASPPLLKSACALKFLRTTEASCADPTRTAFRKRPLPRRLCSCPGKRVVAAQSVTLLAKLLPRTAGHVAMTTFIAVTKTPLRRVHLEEVKVSSLRSNDSPYYLIDSSAWEFVFRTCLDGEAFVFQLEAPRIAYVLPHLMDHRDENSRNEKPQLGGLLPPQE
ncbi:Hypothetical protein, putative, partial [Bodo saltans]